MKRTLIFEDDGKTASALAAGLKGEGFEARTVGSGEDVLLSLSKPGVTRAGLTST